MSRRLRNALIGLAVLVAAGAAVAALLLKEGPDESAPHGVLTRSGDLMGLVRTLVAEMPRPDSNAYVRPTPQEEQGMATAYRAIEAGQLDQAAAAANPLEYDVVRYTDTGTGRNLVLLQERRRADGSWPHAWGTYIFSPGSTSHLVVESPHALDDIDSWVVAVDTFRRGDAAALFLSGASRFAGEDDSADMAHNPDTVFEAINEAALVRQGTIVFQPHGFDTTEHVDYGDVVVSNGTSHPDKITRAVAKGLKAAGFSVCTYNGDRCSGLGGTTNVQGQSITPGRSRGRCLRPSTWKTSMW